MGRDSNHEKLPLAPHATTVVLTMLTLSGPHANANGPEEPGRRSEPQPDEHGEQHERHRCATVEALVNQLRTGGPPPCCLALHLRREAASIPSRYARKRHNPQMPSTSTTTIRPTRRLP